MDNNAPIGEQPNNIHDEFDIFYKQDTNNQLIIDLPRGYILPNNIKKIAPEIWVKLFNNINELMTVDFNTSPDIKLLLITQETKIKDDYTKKIASYTDKIEQLQNEIKSLHNKRLDIDKVSKILESKYSKQIAKLHEKNDRLQDKNEELYEKFNELREEEQSDALLDLTNKLDTIMKFYNGTNQEKGRAGEMQVMEILKNCKRYESAIIEDTTGKGGHGDINLRWRKISCVIEIKNKDKITTNDITKFKRDIKKMKNTAYKVNCGIFISLRSNDYPNSMTIEPFQIEYVNDAPVVYVHLTSPDLLHFAIMTLNKIIESVPNNNTYCIEILQAELKKDIKLFNDEIRKKRKDISTLEKRIKESQKTLNDLENEIARNTQPQTHTPQTQQQTHTLQTQPQTQLQTHTQRPIVMMEKSINNNHMVACDSTFDYNEAFNYDDTLIIIYDYYIEYFKKYRKPLTKQYLIDICENVSAYKLKKYGTFKNLKNILRQIYIKLTFKENIETVKDNHFEISELINFNFMTEEDKQILYALFPKLSKDFSLFYSEVLPNIN